MSTPKKTEITVVVNGKPAEVFAIEDQPLGAIIPRCARADRQHGPAAGELGAQGLRREPAGPEQEFSGTTHSRKRTGSS